MITAATQRHPYVVGKPNPMMFRSALNRIDAHSETTAMVGDRMNTDIVAGMEAGLFTVLVLTGVTGRRDIERFPYRPDLIVQVRRRARRDDPMTTPIKAVLFDLFYTLVKAADTPAWIEAGWTSLGGPARRARPWAQPTSTKPSRSSTTSGHTPT